MGQIVYDIDKYNEEHKDDVIEDIKELISALSYLEEMNSEMSELIMRFEGVLSKAKFEGRELKQDDYRILDEVCCSLQKIAIKESDKTTQQIRKLIHENKLFVSDKKFVEIENRFKDIDSGKKSQWIATKLKDLQSILNNITNIVKDEKENAVYENSTKIEQKPDVEEEIKEIDKSITDKEENGLIPELKILKWADYSKKHPTTKTKSGTTVQKGQFLYIETLKNDWTSKHIHLVSEVNKKIDEFNKVVAENGIEDTQLSKLIASIRVFITKNKEILSDCENFDDVVNAVKLQANEIKRINTSTFNQ